MTNRWRFEIRPDPDRLQRVRPGLYRIGDRDLRLCIPEIIRALGLDDTATNREQLARKLAQAVEEVLQ